MVGDISTSCRRMFRKNARFGASGGLDDFAKDFPRVRLQFGGKLVTSPGGAHFARPWRRFRTQGWSATPFGATPFGDRSLPEGGWAILGDSFENHDVVKSPRHALTNPVRNSKKTAISDIGVSHRVSGHHRFDRPASRIVRPKVPSA